MRLTPPCVFCGEAGARLRFSATDFDRGSDPFDLVECRTCGAVRTEPMLTGDTLASYYQASYYGRGKQKFSRLVESMVRVASRWRARRLLRYWSAMSGVPERSSPAVLDIGCGRGHLLRALARLGCSCHGVEREDFPLDGHLDGVHFYRQDLESAGFTAASFDIVVIWHVLEHLENPAQTLSTVARILRPGGLCVIAVPNFGSFQSRLFKRHWFHLDLPRHIYHFTGEMLASNLRARHLHVREISTASLEQNVFGFIQSLLNLLIPAARPNALYGLLKGGGGLLNYAKLAVWLVPAALILPVALVEYGFASLLGGGASLIIHIEKIE